MGIRQRMAISWALSIFPMVSGHHEPALTVASLATTTTSLPDDQAHAGDDAGARSLAIVAVVGHQQPHLGPRRILCPAAGAAGRAR